MIAAALKQVCGAAAIVLVFPAAFGFANFIRQAPLDFNFLDEDFDIHMGCNSTRLDLLRGVSPAEYALPATKYTFLFSQSSPLAPPHTSLQHNRILAAGRARVLQA